MTGVPPAMRTGCADAAHIRVRVRVSPWWCFFIPVGPISGWPFWHFNRWSYLRIYPGNRGMSTKKRASVLFLLDL